MRAIFILVLLAGCSGAPSIRTVTVKVPVAVSCVPPSLPQRPAYADPDDALRKATDSAERYRLVLIGREQRMARLGALETVVEECR